MTENGNGECRSLRKDRNAYASAQHFAKRLHDFTLKADTAWNKALERTEEPHVAQCSMLVLSFKFSALDREMPRWFILVEEVNFSMT